MDDFIIRSKIAVRNVTTGLMRRIRKSAAGRSSSATSSTSSAAVYMSPNKSTTTSTKKTMKNHVKRVMFNLRLSRDILSSQEVEEELPQDDSTTFYSMSNSLRVMRKRERNIPTRAFSMISQKFRSTTSSRLEKRASDDLNSIKSRFIRFFEECDPSKMDQLDAFYSQWEELLKTREGEAKVNTILFRAYGKDLNNFYAKEGSNGSITVVDQNSRIFSIAPWLQRPSGLKYASSIKRSFTAAIPRPKAVPAF